jgi:hypothetical protein
MLLTETFMAVRKDDSLIRRFYTRDKAANALVCFRCVGEMVTKNKLKAYSVRVATAAEKAGLQRLCFASQRAVTALEMTIPEP